MRIFRSRSLPGGTNVEEDDGSSLSQARHRMNFKKPIDHCSYLRVSSRGVDLRSEMCGRKVLRTSYLVLSATNQPNANGQASTDSN